MLPEPPPNAATPVAAETPPAHEATPAWLAPVLLLLAGLTLCWRTTGDPDTWWHLAAGRAVERLQAIPTTELFSYSFAGQPWIVADWWSDVILWGLWSRTGAEGTALALALAFGAAALAWRWSGDSLARRDWLTLLLATSYMAAISMSVTVRPRLASLLLFPVTLAALERARRQAQRQEAAGASRPSAWILAAPSLWTAGWLLLHRGALGAAPLLVGLPLYLLCARAARWLEPRWSLPARLLGPAPAWRSIVWLAVAPAAVPLAALLHPNGWTVFWTAFNVIDSTTYRGHVTEFMPISLHDALRSFPTTLALGAVAAAWLLWALVGAARGAERWRGALWPASVLVLYVIQAPASVRWLTYVAAAAVAGVAWTAGRLPVNPRPDAGRLPWLLALWSGLVGALWIHAVHAHPLGPGEATGKYPTGALAFAREHELGPRVHNAFRLGGYVIWAGDGRFKVLIDGRNDMVYPGAFFIRTLDAQTDPAAFAAMQAEHPSDWVLATAPSLDPAFTFLDSDPAWVVVYASEEAAIYLRRGARPDLERDAYRWILPGHPLQSLALALKTAAGDPARLQQIEQELLRLGRASPDGVQTLSLLTLFYDALGPSARPRRDAVLTHLQEIAPDHPAVAQLIEHLATGATPAP